MAGVNDILINGKVYEWGDISIIMPYGPSYSAAEISYDDEMETEAVYGTGRKPIGYGKGIWKASGKISILIEEYNLLLLSTAKNEVPGIYHMPPFNIIITFIPEGLLIPSIRTLKGVKFIKRSQKHAIGDKKSMVELDFMILEDIVENGVSSAGGFAIPI